MADQPKSLLHAVAERFQARGMKVPREIASALKHYEAAPESARQRILNAFAIAVPKAGLPEPAWAQGQHRYVVDVPSKEAQEIIAKREAFCPAYPKLAREVQARLVLGHKPEKILPGLTPSEARKALCEGYDGMSSRTTPGAYILRGLSTASDPELRRLPGRIGNTTLARWIAAAVADPQRREALFTERVAHGAGGAEIHGRLIDRLDEIKPEDLPNGPKTSIRDAFTNAGARAMREWEASNETNENRVISPPSWWKPVKYAKLLNTPKKLVQEGRDMQHCVGGPHYLDAVRHGQSTIISFNIHGQRATAELSRDGSRVIQFKAPGNKTPSPVLQRALDVLMRKYWRIGPNALPASRWPRPTWTRR